MNGFTGWLDETPACADPVVVDAQDGRVSCIPARDKLAIVGAASSSIGMAPWTDPAYEIWGMNHTYLPFQRRPDRWFEIHIGEEREDQEFPDYFDQLRQMDRPVYMVDVEPGIPKSVKFPLERVRQSVPAHMHKYFTSSAAYMTALAISENFKTIALYGIDLTIGTEYELQKACLESWLGYAAGQGIEIIVPHTSALFKTPYMYGFEKARAWAPVLRASKAFIDARINELKRQHNETQALLQRLEGSISELEFLWQFAESSGRGAQFPHMLQNKYE